MPTAARRSTGGDDPPSPPRTDTRVLTVDSGLSADHRDQVEQVLARAEAADGFSALNEAAVLALRQTSAPTLHITALTGERVIGYAQLVPDPRSSTGFLVVDPAARRQGVGLRLVQALAERAPTPLQLLAPTDSAPAQALAARAGLVPGRTLLIMKRDLDQPLPEPVVPAGVTIRTFRPGEDEAAWLAVNAAAFASHPEQGAVTAADLAARMAEPWFDPAGFFVAERAGAMVGFHWTKQHPDHLGEVYVLGVAPEGHRQGIGQALLITGLKHLRRHGNHTVELYVEAASDAAVALYSSYGFIPTGRDVMYAQRPIRAPQEG
ncbi:MAG TPA: mycothiol synthase [Propionibacteriaceae bacterium]|nr:mycothiol synthase [Propionibacteriaceae bacterium]